tara:strand:- start:1045 stop:1170 length:126 start_codon:yes stop_codon:yes gene_type:complete
MESLKILQSELKQLLPNKEEDKEAPKIKKKSLFQLFKKPKY